MTARRRRMVVVLGGGLPQGPLIRRARERGHEVCVVDGRTDRPSLALADLAIHQDFSDTDATLARLAEAGVEPVAVVTMASDRAVPPAARLASALGLPALPLEAARAATDKVLQRALFAEHGVPSVGFRAARSAREALAAYDELGPEAVVKPQDGAAQRGVSHVRSREDVEAAAERALDASDSGTAVVEEFIRGDEFTVNGFVLDGRWHLVTITRRELAPPPAFGICTAHRYPAGVGRAEHDALSDVIRRASEAIGIDGAPVYAQARHDGRRARLIEVGARLGGGGDPVLARLVTGVDLVDAVVDAGFGVLEASSLAPRGAAKAACGQVKFLIPPEPGRVVRADGARARALPGVQEVGFYHPEGRVVPPLVSASGRVGYVIVTAPNEAELDRRTDAALAAIDLEVVPLVAAAP